MSARCWIQRGNGSPIKPEAFWGGRGVTERYKEIPSRIANGDFMWSKFTPTWRAYRDSNAGPPA